MMTCKKCGKELPGEHKGKLCEACVGKRVEKIKKYGKSALGVVVAVGGPVIAFATKGKFYPTKNK